MAVTLDDVAQSVGVSKATVSRVLNDDPRISTATRVKVREALGSLGYRGIGRSNGRHGTVAFLIADPLGSVHEDLFFNEVLRGVTEQMGPRGYHALVSPSDGLTGGAGRLPSVVHRSDGVIAGGVSLQPQLVRALMSGPVPVVFIGRYLRGRGMNAILPDNQEGGRLATEYLLAGGHRTIAFLGGPPDSNVLRDRLAGYRQAFEESGLAVDESLLRSVPRTAEAGALAILQILDDQAASDVPDAIFAADDWIALGVLRALRQRGLRIPDDVAVVGYSDIPLASLAEPPLTTVHVPKRRLGKLAAKLLQDLIDGEIEPPVQVTVSPHLVVRESTRGQREALADGTS